jgi:hypothetical protein
MNAQMSYSISGAQQQLGDCSRAHVYRLVNRGLLELKKVGGRSVITGRSIQALLEQSEAA